MENEPKKNDFLLPASIVVAGLMIAGSIVYLVGNKDNSNNPPANNPSNNQAADASSILKIKSSDVILGDPKAPLTLIEYGDYQCPWCGKMYHESEQPLREEYIKTSKVKMVYRNFAFLGPESSAAAEAAECSKDQKQFWAFHDALYSAEISETKNGGIENSGNLTRDLFLKIATDLKLDLPSFTNCVDSKKYANKVEQDNSDGRTAGVKGTPSVFLNDQQIGGFLPFPEIKSSIDSLLKSPKI
ncbi:MAG: thioredoxin domain-containing protein [Candidatus Liptonbacteria bacterium]|nr:thioredoxin domain-containing protein [Candidatus Liptonbacteria bacterium]